MDHGPWGSVDPEAVPLFILRVPVRYYRQPPRYFSGWAPDAPPRWGDHWGWEWEQRRSEWSTWSRGTVPAPAPLPVYQKQYSGDRYPRVELQLELHSRKYAYRPRAAVVQQYYQERGVKNSRAPGQQRKQGSRSAKEYAPGQVKKREGAQSAKEYAPGQVKEKQGAGSKPRKDQGKGKGHGKEKD